jgi:chromate reductase, NAD(P)H dehydrogenase (quinone)
MAKTKTCILSASARTNNNTLRLAKQMAQLINIRDMDCTIIDFQHYDLPSFNEKFIKRDDMSLFQSNMVEAWAEAELIIVLTPEYNWFPTAEIINTVNHLGSDTNKDLWDNKVFAFAGVSTGRGGRMPAVQLTYVFNKIISYTHSKSICSPKIYESHFTAKMIDSDGNMENDSDSQKAIQRFIDYNLDIAHRWND